MVQGTTETKEFYDQVGWDHAAEGVTVDHDLFGVKEDGVLRQGIFNRRWARIHGFLKASGPIDRLLEVGCGGAPEERLLPLCTSYDGVDFSDTGIAVAREMWKGQGDKVRFQVSDAVSLPFETGQFDAVYSAHMIYHIVDPAAQKAALGEMMRVLKPGGRLVLKTANPRPLMFPLRLGMRLVAETPGLNALARRLKGPSPVPYNPQTLRWLRRSLPGAEDVATVTAGMASTAFNQKVTEHKGLGRLLWSGMDRLDRHTPELAAYLGNYAMLLVRKAG